MGNQNPTSNYFTLVVYPYEIKKDSISKLYNLGTIFISPVHHAQNDPFGYIGEFCPSDKPPKPHRHLLIKCSNKITENAFIIRLCDILENDFTGIALHKGDSLVKSPDLMLRYFFHLDNPMKEHFNLEDAFENVPSNFTDEVIRAFNLEITMRVSFGIQSGELENIQQVMLLYSNSAITTKWLYTGKNMYVVNSMFNENRRNGRLR